MAALPAVAQASENDDFFDAVRINTRAPRSAPSRRPTTSEPAPTRQEPVPRPATSISPVRRRLLRRHGLVLVLPARKGPGARHGHHVGRLQRPRGVGHPLELATEICGHILIEGQCNGPVPGLERTDVPINGYIDVAGGQQYAIQVGGAKSPNNAGGTADTGNYSVFLEYDPDSDRDGLFDSEDQCDFEAGPAALNGCPDNDGDGMANKDDLCPNLAGGPTHQGCPDADGDGVPEGGGPMRVPEQ